MAKMSINYDSDYINNKIKAIKALRNATEHGLKEAKDIVDRMYAGDIVEYNISNSQASELEKSGWFRVIQDINAENLKDAAAFVKQAMGLLLESDKSHYLVLLANAFGQMKAEIEGIN